MTTSARQEHQCVIYYYRKPGAHQHVNGILTWIISNAFILLMVTFLLFALLQTIQINDLRAEARYTGEEIVSLQHDRDAIIVKYGLV